MKRKAFGKKTGFLTIERGFYAAIVLSTVGLALFLLHLGVVNFRKNFEAFSWKPVLAKIVACESSVAKEILDEETSEEEWRVNFKVSYEYVWSEKTFQGSFKRAHGIGQTPPTPAQAASITASFRQNLGDGFSVFVNPNQPGESLFEPSLVGPSLTIFGGLLILAVLIYFLRVVFQQQGEPVENRSFPED